MDPHLQQAGQAIVRTLDALPAGALATASHGPWSVAEILEHLTLAYRGTTASIERALASGAPAGARPRLPQAAARILVSDIGYFPRAESPALARPTGSIAPADIPAAIRDALEALDRALAVAEARFGGRVLVSNHPYFAGLSVSQWRKFHWRHTEHHMRQVRARAVSPRRP